MSFRTSFDDVQKAIHAAFPVKDILDRGEDIGVCVLPITGYYLRRKSPAELVEMFRNSLPADVTFFEWEGLMLRMMTNSYGSAKDELSMIVGSREWPVVEEGALLPLLNIISFAPVADLCPEAEELQFNHFAIDPNSPVSYRINVPKAHFEILTPRELETPNSCTIIIQPLKNEQA